MSQTDLNPSQPELSSSHDAFQTPWQKRFLGKQEQLVLSRNATGMVTAQIISKVVSQDVFKSLSNFFGRKQADQPAENLTVEIEKKFTNISTERFENELKEIQKLLDKHTSLAVLLKQVEKDLTGHHPSYPPDITTLNPKKTEERRQAVIQMRAELETLMKKIDEEESSPELQSYEQLKSSIERIKKGALSAFSKINDLQGHLNDPKVSKAQIQELAAEIGKIEASNNDWSRDFASVRKIAMEKQSLQTEIDLRTEQIQSCPEEMKKQWDECLANWKHFPVSGLSSLSQVQQYRQEMSRTIAKIGEEYKKELSGKITSSFTQLQASLDATSPDFSNQDKQQAHLDFRAQVLASRKKVWFSFNEIWRQSENDFNVIAQLQQSMINEEAIDKALVKTLEIKTDEESTLEKIFAFLSPLTSIITPLLPDLPSFLESYRKSSLLKEIERFDEASLFYVNQTMQRTNRIITRLLDLIPNDDMEEFIEEFDYILTSDSLMESDFNSFIEEIISFSQNAMNDKDEEDDDLDLDCQAINEAINELQGLKEVLPVMIKSQQGYAETVVKKAKAEYAVAFDQNTRSSILEAAQASANEILPDDVSDYDLRTLSSDWQNVRTSTSTQLDTLKYLEILENLQKEYQGIAKKREKEIGPLTGEEKTKANIYLEDLQKAIDSLDEMLDEYQADASMVISYKTKLLKINSAFDPLFQIENQKKEMRVNINREINAFNAHLNQCLQAVEEIERHYFIKLKDAKELIDKKREAIKEWKDQGILPPAYLKYAPASALPTILYYGASQLPFEDRKVTDLNLSDLDFYIENLKAVIANQKSELSSNRILESSTALKTFQDASKDLESHIKNLTGKVTIKTNFSGENHYQIPEGLSSNDLAKLQFHNATLTGERQKNLLSKQKTDVSSKPNLKFIHQKLKNDTDTLKNIFEQSKKGTTLSLLDQIEKLENYPEQQAVAKKAFLETVTTKMSEHTKMMTNQAKTLKNHPKIYDEAVRQIQRTEREFFKRLKTAPEAVQLHAEGWHTIKDGKFIFSTKDDLSIESLSVIDLKRYVDSIDKTINQGNDFLKLIRGTYAKAEQASRKFQEKIKEAKQALKDLDKKDQLIEMQRLNNIMAHAEKAKDDYTASSEPAEEGLFSSIITFTTSSKNISPSRTAIKLLEDYKKNIGNSISKIDAALRKVRQGKILSIAQQLAQNPDDNIVNELRQRFNKKTQPLINKCREKLEEYKEKGIAIVYTRYVAPSSSLLSQIKEAIDRKLYELDRFEKSHRSGSQFTRLTNLVSNLSNLTPVAELSASEMEDYFRQLTRLEKTLADDLNKKYEIDNLSNAQYNYEVTLNETVKKQAAKLRGNGLFTEAFLLERKVDEITEKEAKWAEKITQIGQFKDLVADLKKFTREMSWAIDEFSPKKTPSSFEDQIRVLLARKEEYSRNRVVKWVVPDEKNQEILDQIDADIHTLKSKMVTKIDEGYGKHQDNLNKLRNEIDEIYSTYNISIQSKESVIDAIDSEITRFEYEASKFNTPYYPILNLLTNNPKHVQDMEPTEIVQVRPEKNHQALIDGSLKKISESFNYKLIQEPHTVYKECLEKAEKTCAILTKKEQIFHAYELDEKIKKIKKAHEECSKTNIANNDQLAKLSKDLLGLSSRLKAAESTAISQPDIDITEQIGQLNTIESSSPYREKLRNSIIKNIQETIENQKQLTNKSMKYIDNLVKQIGLPHNWRETITNELDKCLEELEHKYLSLIAQYSKNPTDRPKHTHTSFIDQFGKQIGVPQKWRETVSNKVDDYREDIGNYVGDKVDNFREGVGNYLEENNPKLTNAAKTGYHYTKKIYDYLKTPTGELPLSELNLNDLVSIQKALKTEEDKIKQVDKKYRLKSLNEQLKSYEIQINNIESLKKDWTNKYNFKSAEILDKMVSACKKEFEEYFELRANGNLQNNMHDLFSRLKETTDNLYYAAAKIKKIEPQSLGRLLQAEEVGSPEYNILKKAVRKQTEAKLSDHKKALTAYFKKIDHINEQILKKIPDCPSLPINWRRAVEDKINTKQFHLEQLATGLPCWNSKNSDWDWKPFEDLSKEEIWLYETYVNHIAAKEDKKKNPTSFQGNLEQLIHLEEIEKYCTHFQKATKDLETAIAKPSNTKDKKTTLESMLAATNQLVFSSINNLESFCDTSFFLQTLEQGQATLYSASQETEPLVIKTDPWAEILEYEESKEKGIFPGAPVEHIISNGFQISYRSFDNNQRKDQICNVVSLKQKITTIKSHFEETKKRSETTSIYMRDQGYDKHPEYQSLMEYLTIRIPEIENELTKLETEATIIDNRGNVSQLKVNEISTFKDLLNYKNQLDKVHDDYYAEEGKVFESDFLNWCNQHQKAKETQENNEGAIVVTEVDPEFSNIDIDSESDDSTSEISQKSTSNKPRNSNMPKNSELGTQGSPETKNKGKEPVVNFPNSIFSDSVPVNDDSKSKKSKHQPIPKEFVPYQAPQVNLSELQADLEITIGKDMEPIKIMTDAIEQMNKALNNVHPNVGDLDPQQLDDFALKQLNNQLFVTAYNTFKSVWGKTTFPNDAKMIKEYSKAVEKILPFDKKEGVFIPNLLGAYQAIMQSTDVLTVNQWIVHVKNLCQASKIKVQLENIANYSRQIFILSTEADKVLNDELIGGKSNILSTPIVDDWLKQIDNYSKISSSTDLEAIENKLKSLADTCGNILKKDSILRNKKTSLHKEIQEFERKFKKKIDFIQKEFGSHLIFVDSGQIPMENSEIFQNWGKSEHSPIDLIANPAYKKIRMLKEKELSDLSLNQLEVNKNTTFQEIENTCFLEGYLAAKKYKILLAKAEIKIKNLCTSKQFATAEKLKVDLESARGLFSLIKWDFKEFAEKIEPIIEKIQKNLEKDESPIDFISQLNQITDANAYTEIANAIIDGFIETAKKIKENSEIPCLNQKLIPHQILDKLKEINTNTNALIIKSKSLTKLVNKQDFIAHVNTTKKKFTEALEIISNIKKAIDLSKNIYDINFVGINIPTCLMNADLLLTNLEKIKDPKAYFHINKVQKLRADLILSAKTFMECLNNSQEIVETSIENAKKLEKFLNGFDSALEKINKAKQMNLFEQLEAAEVEPGILSPELEQKIIDRIKKCGKDIIDETIKTVKEYEEYAYNFPGVQTSQISMIIDAVSEKFKNLKLEIVNVKDSKKLQQWIKTIRKEQTIAINHLEDILKLKTHKKDAMAYQSLMDTIRTLLYKFESQSSKYESQASKYEARLREAVYKMEIMRQQLLQNFTDFKTYWKNLNTELTPLKSFVEEIKSDLM